MKSTHDDQDEIDQKRLDLRALMLKALDGVLPQDGDAASVALMDLAMSQLTKKHAAKLDAKSKSLIRENYPAATDFMMKDRALNEVGDIQALAMAKFLGVIAIDYSPISHFSADMAADEALAKDGTYAKMLNSAHTEAIQSKMSAFGASATMILMGVALGLKAGLHPIKVVRPLLDGLQLAIENRLPQPLTQEQEAEMLKGVAKQMGISLAEAKKYMEHVKQMIASGKTF